VQIGDNRAAEWVRRSNPVALGLLFSGLAGQKGITNSNDIKKEPLIQNVFHAQSPP
jgi:hypothetical protein